MSSTHCVTNKTQKCSYILFRSLQKNNDWFFTKKFYIDKQPKLVWFGLTQLHPIRDHLKRANTPWNQLKPSNQLSLFFLQHDSSHLQNRIVQNQYIS